MTIESIQTDWIDVPASYDAHFEQARELAATIETGFSRKLGCIQKARRFIARRVGGGLTAGTLENIKRGRIKRIDSWWLNGLVRLFQELCEHEMRRITNELAKAKKLSAPVSEAEIYKALSLLKDARDLLGESD